MRLGVKTRWTDAEQMALLGTDLMEVFIHEKDLILHKKEMIKTFSRISEEYNIELVLHNQAYFIDGGNYHLVDLASQDERLRQQAVKIVKKTLELANELDASYVIVHPGGITPKKKESKKLLSTLIKSLKEIRNDRLIIENMPWFYVMRNGQVWRSNICIYAEEFFDFSDLVGGVTLDICHAYLSTDKGDQTHVINLKKSLKGLIKHVHASDAKPPYHEGLQINEGLVDFDILKDFDVGIIPEIIDGHLNGGEGFKIAIERLRGYE